jgi:hypothetical protein
MQTGSEEGNNNEGNENKYNVCYLEMLKKGRCVHMQQVFTVCEYITNFECLLAEKFNTKFYFEQQVNQYMKGGIPTAKCSE